MQVGLDRLITDELADLLLIKQTGARLQGIFNGNNLTTMEELVTCSRFEMLRCPNMGKKSLRLLEQALADRGLRLGMTLEGHHALATSRHEVFERLIAIEQRLSNIESLLTGSPDVNTN